MIMKYDMHYISHEGKLTVLVGRRSFAPVFRNLKMPFLLSVCSTGGLMARNPASCSLLTCVCSTSQCRDAGNGTSTRAGWAGVKAICIYLNSV